MRRRTTRGSFGAVVLFCTCGAAGLLAGCTDARDPGPATPPDLPQPPGTLADTLADTLAAGRASPPDTAQPPVARSGARDRGIGILAFDRRLPAGSGGAGGDTLLIYRDTAGRRIIARFIYRGDASSWSWTVESEPPVESASMEFAYEVEGLPVDRLSEDRRWALAILGIGPDGEPREGWVQVAPGTSTFTQWTSVLRDRPLFFDDGIEPEFFGSPRGTPVDFPLDTGGGVPTRADYIMHPLQVQGDWMQVRVATPSDYCASPTDPEVRQTMVWIRHLDDRGRPRVWYYTRGC